MRREFLADLGLEKDIIDKILDKAGEDLRREKLKAERFENELEDLKGQYEGVDVKQLKTDVNTWRVKFEDLEKRVNTEKEEAEFNDFLKTNFNEFKVRDSISVKAHLDFDKIKNSKDMAKELKEQLSNVQKEKAYLFEVDNNATPNNVYNYVPEGGNVGNLSEEQQLEQDLMNAIRGI